MEKSRKSLRNGKQKLLQKKGMVAKDLANLSVDIQKNTDLKSLVKVGVTFWSLMMSLAMSMSLK